MNLRTLMVASVMATGLACGAASAQSAGMYVLHAKASGSCPAMDWHLALDPSATVNNVKGMIGWDDMKHIARVVRLHQSGYAILRNGGDGSRRR